MEYSLGNLLDYVNPVPFSSSLPLQLVFMMALSSTEDERRRHCRRAQKHDKRREMEVKKSLGND